MTRPVAMVRKGDRLQLNIEPDSFGLWYVWVECDGMRVEIGGAAMRPQWEYREIDLADLSGEKIDENRIRY